MDGATEDDDKIGAVKMTKLAMFSRPMMAETLTEIGLMLDQTKTLLAKLQEGMLRGQGAEYAAHR